MRALLLAVVALVSVSASAFQPRTGQWWNPSESGSGYNVDIQDGTLVLTTYSYTISGAAQWYFYSGDLSSDGRTLMGTLDRYYSGQCISCPVYPGFPASGGNDGAFKITFTSETSAILTLPGGRTTAIQPFDFGFGEPPQGLLGEWVFVYDVGNSTIAERYNFGTIAGSTPHGNGVVVDRSRRAGCELQTTGELAGYVICVDVDLSGNINNGFVFRFGLDETFEGVYLSLYDEMAWPMKGFKVTSRRGFTRWPDPLAFVAADNASQETLPTKATPAGAPFGNGGFARLREALIGK